MQENYLKANYSKSSNLGGIDKELRNLELAALAAEAMSDGDLVDRMIHGCVFPPAIQRFEADELGDHIVSSTGRSCRYTECSPAFDPLRTLTVPEDFPISLRTSAFSSYSLVELTRLDTQMAGKELNSNEERSIVGRNSNSNATQGFWRSKGDSTAVHSYSLLSTCPSSCQRRSSAPILSSHLRIAFADFS